MATPAPRTVRLPVPHEMQASPAWRSIELVSDLHLSQDTPRTFEAFDDYLRDSDADAVFILGDLFEVWVGDDARADAFEARCAAMLRASAQRRCTGFMAGNRDFLVGAPLLDACGVVRLPDPTALSAFGLRWMLTHGDALCLDDDAYLEFRSEVRSPAWQQAFLARPLAERRRLARGMRERSEQGKPGRTALGLGDIDRAATLRWMCEAAAPGLIHGHTHRPGSEPLDAGHARHVLSDWDFDHGVARAEILRLDATGIARRTFVPVARLR